jgi:hypothetical protein
MTVKNIYYTLRIYSTHPYPRNFVFDFVRKAVEATATVCQVRYVGKVDTESAILRMAKNIAVKVDLT